MDKNKPIVDILETKKSNLVQAAEDQASAAMATYEMYRAYVLAGFSPAEAINLTSTIIIGLIAANNKK